MFIPLQPSTDAYESLQYYLSQSSTASTSSSPSSSPSTATSTSIPFPPDSSRISDDQDESLFLEPGVLEYHNSDWRNEEKKYESARVLWDEEVMTSRCLLTVETMSFGKSARRHPSEIAFRLSLSSGIFLSLHSLDFRIYLHPLNELRLIGGRKVKPKAMFSEVVPTSEIGFQVEGEYKFRYNKNDKSVRFVSEWDEERWKRGEDQLPADIPIFCRMKHTDSLAFILSCRITYTVPYDPESEPEQLEPITFTRFYQRILYLHRTDLPFLQERNLDVWANAASMEGTEEEELGDSGNVGLKSGLGSGFTPSVMGGGRPSPSPFPSSQQLRSSSSPAFSPFPTNSRFPSNIPVSASSYGGVSETSQVEHDVASECEEIGISMIKDESLKLPEMKSDESDTGRDVMPEQSGLSGRFGGKRNFRAVGWATSSRG